MRSDASERHTETPIATPWFTVDEAASYLRTGRRLVYAEVSRGRLKAARVGARRQLRFHRAWLDAYLDACVTA
jgi:excisionase family DNA binding protein